MKKFNYLSVLLVLWVGFKSPVFSQVNVLGKPGHVLTPSAQWDTLRQVGFSFGTIPESYSINNFMKRHVGPEHIYGVKLPITGFMEVNINFTRKPELANRIGVGDRHIDVRLHLLKERKILPSVVLVLTPPEGESTFLSQDLLVATKNVLLGTAGTLQISGGFSSPNFYRVSKTGSGDSRGFARKTSLGNNYLNGFFGSLQWQPWEFMGLIVEHDSQKINTGMFVHWKERFYLQGNLIDNREIGITTSVRFPLDFSPFELRRYAKNR
ncbi:YjbH domain-containing protein [Lunatibacter salilacus]|uniref:YjbH domain-containing protein n=1 Tax=Lunatibacter salilacus TaxID=2483804 RepID=UPI00131BD562|nr:YjbH domain-containing protein [Lunatibacter salilacus]